MGKQMHAFRIIRDRPGKKANRKRTKETLGIKIFPFLGKNFL